MKSGIPLGYMLSSSRRVFKNQMTSEFRKNNICLTFEQYVILKLLEMNAGFIQQDLVERLQTDKSIIVRQINCLLENNYVVTIPNQEDKRKKNFALTTLGASILGLMKESASEVTDKLLSGVPEKELEIFQKVLVIIQNNCDNEQDISKYNNDFQKYK